MGRSSRPIKRNVQYDRVPRDLRGTNAVRDVFAALHAYSNYKTGMVDHPKYRPGYPALAAEAELSESTVKRGIQKLEREGWIEIIPVPGQCHKYRLLVEWAGGDG